jgi:peptidoglycan hydrolase CwlO-like protein
MPKLDSDISAIKECLKYIQRDIQEIKECNSKVDDRITKSENDIISIQTRIGIFAGLQVGFSIVVGAVAKLLQ